MKKVKVLDKVVMFQQLPQGGIEVNMRATIEQYILFGDQETFEFVSERSEADIIPMIINDACWRGNEVSSDWFNMCSKLFNKKQIALNISFIFHIDELQTWRHHLELYSTKFNSDSSPFKKVVNLHNDTMLRDDPNRTENFIYTDFLFNRSHTVHFDNHLVKAKWNDVTAKNHWWRSANDIDPNSKFPSSVYELTPDDEIIPRLARFKNFIDGDEELTEKIFVAPNLTRRGINSDRTQRSKPREILNTLLYKYQGYIGDVSQGTALLPNRDSYDYFDILGIHGWGFSPPHNDYYDTSAISIYVETLIYHEEHKTTCITEKTFTPMCKGHFVLPFGTPGTIDHLKLEYGFEFPEWLDYKYDNLPGTKDDSGIINSPRWNSYLSTVKSVCELGAEKLCLLKSREIETLLHNRSIMRDNGQKHGLHDPQVLQEIMA
jgi:hypothetical protein